MRKSGSFFHFSWLLPIFAVSESCDMEENDCEGILFADSIGEYDLVRYADRILHILCTEGSMSFVFCDVRYNIVQGDYIILPQASFVSDFTASPGFKGIIMSLSEPFVASMGIRSNYGFIGHMALLQNPVMKLSQHDFRKCLHDMERIRERLEEKDHLFREEMMGHLLTAHILDLYDIHARGQEARQIPERAAKLISRFIGMLYDGSYIADRDLEYYASRLCITPHYLTEISKKVSGRPATWWIDRFTLYEIVRLLHCKELSVAEIAERLHFSSLSYFSRYVQKRLGISPSAYRSELPKN